MPNPKQWIRHRSKASFCDIAFESENTSNHDNSSPSGAISADGQGCSECQGHCSLTEWLTSEEAAKYLKVSVASLRNMTSNGKIPYYKFDRRNRYRVDDLRKLILKNPKGGFYGN